jgi:hypothetical protein
MVKITFSPATELVVHDIAYIELDDLLRERVTPAGTIPLYWCNGIVFSFTSLPLTDEVVRDYMHGRLHWLEVHFSAMPKYTEILKLNEEEYKAAMSVRIIDTSKSGLHNELTRWLKDELKRLKS